jgi:hypothetical protein
MDGFYIYLIIIGSDVLLIFFIVILHLRYRIAEKEKNRSIFLQIQEQTRLARELEHARIENHTLEKIIQTMMSEKNGSTEDSCRLQCKPAKQSVVL